MSAPSRRPEIRRRRTRAEKVAKLRKRLAAASASNDKDRLTAKLHRVGSGFSGQPAGQERVAKLRSAWASESARPRIN